MLRFTEEQQAAVVNQRRAFNAQQIAMAETHRLTAEGANLLGNASPMPRDVWGEWDNDGLMVQRSMLAVFNDLAASVARPFPIGKLISYFQQISDSGEVNVSLDGRSTARTDQQTYAYVGTPVPIVNSTFSYGWRQVAAAQTEGVQLDDAGRLNSNRKISETLETWALDGNAKMVVAGAPLYGIRTHPKRSTRSTTNDLSTCTGAEWLADVNATTALLYAKNVFAEPTLYVNINDWKYARETDFSTSYPGKTIAQRVLESGVANVVPSSSVAADEIIAVVKDPTLIRVLNAMPPTTVPLFRANPHDDYNFMSMGAAVVEVRYDTADQSGIAHSS
ncbi:major capsid protein [Pseudooceanicola atlanticus]|uniref:Encapsulating for peroxidase n=1 Tax=Pseudooceanicola atlanticus TaxID=1461694 RepID=A0A0A0EK26_9RHOB|nr:major capsid protein [Pseudooceanicola atlanticus]KGM50655.1 hypothetical protein ATO9_04060 [Pseudooceanicola atlanticus]